MCSGDIESFNRYSLHTIRYDIAISQKPRWSPLLHYCRNDARVTIFDLVFFYLRHPPISIEYSTHEIERLVNHWLQ